ncbi:hypothetical protein KGF56_000449 [Candida oxycetoniae]|uniref:Uncharacterized protein n=1 Tax=Candida oxycetoniae TaxID=497107 RepID=A0AAI9T127_9ASCO|nr:uncharacterized protein KGF56_000449 [Candida oxycetoniae]KAI3406843.2 hypothetical protein KGF56_000449 [Candida oxycetoniae]
MSEEKERLRQKYEKEEQLAYNGSSSHGGGGLPEAPPAYEDIQSQQNPYTNEKLDYEKPPQANDHNLVVNQDQPNVYKTKPELVNINDAPAEYLNPQYAKFRQNQQSKVARGEHANWDPKPLLNPGHVSNQKIQSSFPGKSGATYHNAADKQ